MSAAETASGEWVVAGRLYKTRGIRGELTAEVYSSQPGRAEKLREVRLEKGGIGRPAEVERAWYHGGRLVLKFAGIDSISDAEPWEGSDVLVKEEDRVKPAEGEYSHQDLIGCTLVDEAGGNTVGVVRGVEDYGAAPLLKVEAVEGREILVPFARVICREIDVAAKTIRVQLPAGLLDL
ncbi:MAG TPA: ribosome maturation factor RimM [Bryobacteraceae bacterium]